MVSGARKILRWSQEPEKYLHRPSGSTVTPGTKLAPSPFYMRKLKPTEVKRQLEITDSLCKGWGENQGLFFFEEENGKAPHAHPHQVTKRAERKGARFRWKAHFLAMLG